MQTNSGNLRSSSAHALRLRFLWVCFLALLLFSTQGCLHLFSHAAAPETAPTASSSGTMPGVKRGSENDVNAAGARNIGGRGLHNLYSATTENEWGEQYSQQLKKTAKFITGPMVNDYITRIGQRIAANSDARVPFTFRIIDSPEINAFALPGGYLYINSGLILAADNEAELAGVIAHEVAHVAAHHQAREMTRMDYTDIATAPFTIIPGASEAGSLVLPLAFTHFQRGYESEADWLGIQYMYRAGYDPEQFIAFFQKIERLQKSSPGLLAKAFSTHPQTPERVARSHREIATILPYREQNIVDTPEFHVVQARLKALQKSK